MLVRRSRKPRGFTQWIKGPVILAHGESTGHAHVAFNVDIYVNDEGRRYLKAHDGATIRHGDLSALLRGDIPTPDHHPVLPEILREGWWEVIHQYEYQRKELRRVVD